MDCLITNLLKLAVCYKLVNMSTTLPEALESAIAYPEPVKRPTTYQNHHLRLNAEAIAVIKMNRGKKGSTIETLAQQFGVCESTIWRIQSGSFQPRTVQLADWIINAARQAYNLK